ncbi:MAG: hypothetical protein LBB39_03065, partial [Mycoplasmataceae bacterium]|nr:hypothetical protein [Mycoplasmataceae bacterium]
MQNSINQKKLVMQTADESYKAELQKFKEDMNKALLEINTLVFMLELGSYGMKPSIRDVLKL